MKFDVEVHLPRRTGFCLDVRLSLQTNSLGIVGPSGCGKSTLLDVLAGVERLADQPGARGHVTLDGRALDGVPLHRRKVGYVTQEPLLFPHLDVAAQLAYGRGARAVDVAAVVDALALQPLLERMPSHLSGGERRRVALARALATRPELLLLDEPFTGLDESRRRRSLSLLSEVRRRFGVPLVLVSHVPDEIVGVVDHALRLDAGRLVALGPPTSVLRAGELSIDNHFVGTVTAPGRVRCDDVELAVPLPRDARGTHRLACYAHDILLATRRPPPLSARNVFATTVTDVTPVGEARLVSLTTAGLRATLTAEAVDELGLAPGVPVVALLKATSVAWLGPT